MRPFVAGFLGALTTCSCGGDETPSQRVKRPRDAGTQPNEAETSATPTDAMSSDTGVATDGARTSTCSSTCPLGDERCTGTVLEQCLPDDQGCARWAEEEDCATRAMLCRQETLDASCVEAHRCDDGLRNQDETDVDCGGSTCAGCDIDAGCELERDCREGICWSGRCVEEAPSCRDAFLPTDDFRGPGPLPWPLTSKESGLPREALGNSFGEYQQYGSEPAYLHSGIDIRGLEGDYVRVVADGNIWLTANLAECEDGTTCRLYIKDSDGRHVYYYSHLRLSSDDAMSVVLRDRIMNATARGAGHYDVQPDTEVRRGETLSAIADFYNDEWAHLHFSIFDSEQHFDGINPLSALKIGSADPRLVDDEPPFVSPLKVRPEGSSEPPVQLDRCAPLSGRVDIVARMGDAFFTEDPAPEAVPGSIDSIGVYSAHTLIEDLASRQVRDIPWYDFGRAAIACAGPLRGGQCPDAFTLEDFLAGSIDLPDGAPTVGAEYTELLFDRNSSSSEYFAVETYHHVLTHSWGEEGSWDTTAIDDGTYRVSVEAADQAGNRTMESQLVVVDNGGGFDPNRGPPDAIVRDHPKDRGAVPSTAWPGPSFSSPDILIVPSGTPIDVEAPALDSPLDAGSRHDVYVRVTNESCSPISGVQVRLSSYPTNLAISTPQRVGITAGAEFVTDASHPGGLALEPGETGLLGPFPYEPAGEAASSELRWIVAEIDATSDRRDADRGVTDDNNAAVRTVRIRSAGAVTDARFLFGNPGPGAACVQLVVELVGLSIADGSTRARLEVPEDTRLLEAWQGAGGLNVETEAETTTLTLLRRRVALPPISMEPGAMFDVRAALEKAPGSAGRLRVYQFLGNRLTGGVEIP